MKNVTFSCDDTLLRKARDKARREKSTLNAVFRSWLERYAGARGSRADFESLMNRFAYVDAGKRFGRDELNER